MKKIPVPVYVGMDVAKATLQVHLNGHQFEFSNDAKGHAQLTTKLARLPLAQVVCEATGGYERPVVEACHKAEILISVLNPAHTLAASQAQGKRAKSDPCDAAALTDYGQRFRPEPTAAVPPAVREITELTLWLKQLIDNCAVVKTQAEHQGNSFVSLRHQELLAHYQSQIQTVEKEIKKLVLAQASFQQRVDCLTAIQGVGFRTALLTLVFLPELGTMNRGGTAALAGLAPWTRDSGTMKGKRCIGGGRAQVRPVIYMAALSASRCNPVLAPLYKRLKKREKPSKVALTAVMRRLLIHMNSELKKLALKPVNQKIVKSKKNKILVAK
jgi:transposase